MFLLAWEAWEAWALWRAELPDERGGDNAQFPQRTEMSLLNLWRSVSGRKTPGQRQPWKEWLSPGKDPDICVFLMNIFLNLFPLLLFRLQGSIRNGRRKQLSLFSRIRNLLFSKLQQHFKTCWHEMAGKFPYALL